LSGKKILIVDDNDNNLDILSHFLVQEKIETTSLSNARDVLPTIENALKQVKVFDLCILDIQMPDMSGYEVAKKIHNHPDSRIANLPLLAFSSSTSKRTRMYRDSGFDGFLPKPIQRYKLLTMIRRLLGEEIQPQEKRIKQVVITQHTLAEDAKHAIRILLAEDNQINQRLAVFMLTKAGYQLEIADNGKELLEKFSAHPDAFDLIFMDINMPEMDGLEATKLIRKMGYADIPIIAMTADVMKEDQERCLASGMNDYISKPIKREIVFNMIQKWVFKD